MRIKVRSALVALLSFAAATFAYAVDKPYPYGMPRAVDNVDDAYLQAEYEDWKAHYLTWKGCPSANGPVLRIQRDAATGYDTVSEGIGYGMLLAVYFGDRDVFNGLYAYATRKLVANTPVMHWLVNSSGVRISEANRRIPHGDMYVLLSRLPDVVLLWDVWKYPDVLTDPEVAKYIPSRADGSALDADMDIAAALCLGYYKWGQRYYKAEAKKIVRYILDFETKNNHIKNGSEWGGPTGWNPSYFAPAWLRLCSTLFDPTNTDDKNYIDRIKSLIDNMYLAMDKIDAVNGSTGLFPDWCSTAGTGVEKSLISDRKYYLDEDGDGALDDRNNDGRIDDLDGYNLLSFNSYYDAIRVAWRMAVEYSWYGTGKAKKYLNEMADFYKDKIPDMSIVDGYAIDGTPWRRADRDGFNSSLGGLYPSAPFVAMGSTATLSWGNQYYSEDCYNRVIEKKEPYSDRYHYYGNTLRLLSLVYLSGKMQNLSQQPRR